jgi:putative membrane protein
MPERLKEFLQRWLISTVAALVATYLVPGITYQTWIDLFVATFILGLLNVFVRPILMLFSLPLLIFTLGLFTLVINALLLYFVGFLLAPKFAVHSFGAAFWGALVITIVSLILNSLTGTGGARFKVETRKGGPRPPRGGDDGGGPVIDV